MPRAHWQRHLAVLVTAIGFVVLLAPIILPPVGAWLIVADPPLRADAIVPLAGDRIRVTYAGKLLAQHQAQWFAITDMQLAPRAANKPYAQLVVDQASREGVPQAQIVIVPGTVATTYQEIQQILRCAQAQGWQSVIIVTNTYHTRRAGAIVHQIFRNSGITISIQPVANDWYQPATWWRSAEGWRVTAEEYGKYALYLVGYHQFAGK